MKYHEDGESERTAATNNMMNLRNTLLCKKTRATESYTELSTIAQSSNASKIRAVLLRHNVSGNTTKPRQKSNKNAVRRGIPSEGRGWGHRGTNDDMTSG